MKMSKLTAATRVYYGDLNLRTVAGRDLLRYRVWQAAKSTCDRLDELNASNIPLTREDSCMKDAMARAQPQINRAFAFG